MSRLTFLHLNPDWNAEPNAPALEVAAAGGTLTLSFRLNPFAYEAFETEMGHLVFKDCRRWRRDDTNDHAWFAGRGRLSKQAPKWGEFYEIGGEDPTTCDLDWQVISPDRPSDRHFLFYFRDETIECFAADWSLTREEPDSR